MKICVVAPNYLPHHGGAEVGTHLILRHLARAGGHECHVIAPTTDASLPEEETIEGVQVHRYRRPKLWARWYAPTFFAFLHTGRILREIQPDVLLISYILPTGLAAFRAAKQQGIPVAMVLVGHDIYDPFHMPDAFLQKQAANAISQTQHIIASSSFIRERLISHLGAQPENICVIPYGIETDLYRTQVTKNELRQEYHIPENAVMLFALQRLEMRKGTEVLIRSMQHVVDRCGRLPIHLLIGGSGSDAAELQALVEEEHLSPLITFAGFIPEIEKAAHYSAADIFVLHSYHEGLGIVLQEAAAMGRPVIATRAGGTVDVVRDGETGRLVQPGDALALAQAICELAADKDLRRQMGRAGRVFAREYFEVEEVAAQFLSVLEAAYKGRTNH